MFFVCLFFYECDLYQLCNHCTVLLSVDFATQDVGSNAHSYFKQCIQEGVRYLMRMLQVRNSVKLNDGVVLHDTTTASFLSEGKCTFFYLAL